MNKIKDTISSDVYTANKKVELKSPDSQYYETYDSSVEIKESEDGLDVNDLSNKQGETVESAPVRKVFESSAEIYYLDVDEKGKKVPIKLTRDIEQELIRTANDLRLSIDVRRTAFTKLLTAYDRYIRALINRDYKYSNVPDDDLMQAGYEGFMESIRNYDPERSNGGRLITYAFHHIKKNINKLINSLAYAVKVITTKDATLAKTQIQKIKAERKLTNQDYEDIAAMLNNKTAAYVRQIEGALTKSTSFEGEDDDESNYANPSYYVSDENSDFATIEEEAQHRSMIHEAFFEAFNSGILDDRERIIVQYRIASDFFPEVETKLTLAELAKQFNVSNERVRQIEQKAKEKLRGALSKFDPNK